MLIRNSNRTMRSHKGFQIFWSSLVLLCFFVQVLAPKGYMLGQISKGESPIVVCSGHLNISQSDPVEHDKKSDSSGFEIESCPFNLVKLCPSIPTFFNTVVLDDTPSRISFPYHSVFIQVYPDFYLPISRASPSISQA